MDDDEVDIDELGTSFVASLLSNLLSYLHTTVISKPVI